MVYFPSREEEKKREEGAKPLVVFLANQEAQKTKNKKTRSVL
jgi:hypothetical protein